MALWRGDRRERALVAAVTGTVAMALKLTGRATSIDEAEAQARQLWAERNRSRF